MGNVHFYNARPKPFSISNVRGGRANFGIIPSRSLMSLKVISMSDFALEDDFLGRHDLGVCEAHEQYERVG